MKRQVKVVAGHARRHRALLDEEWAQTDWTRPQAEEVLRRIDGVLACCPKRKNRRTNGSSASAPWPTLTRSQSV